jgi:hypothetical protein
MAPLKKKIEISLFFNFPPKRTINLQKFATKDKTKNNVD